METILFCGSRTWDDQRTVDRMMQHLRDMIGDFTVLHGGALGADMVAWFAAKKLSLPVRCEKPDWARDGKRAGIFRNIRMLEMKPSMVVAFWDGMSRGTYHTMDNAVGRYRIPTLVITRQTCA